MGLSRCFVRRLETGGRLGGRAGLHAAISLALGFLFGPGPCLAAWPGDPAVNLPISTSLLSQDEPQIVSDGSGGVIVVWEAANPGGPKGIYAQHVDRAGQVVWGDEGLVVCGVPSDQEHPVLAPDSSGGAIIVWQDHRSDWKDPSDWQDQRSGWQDHRPNRDWDLYAQRIDRYGQLRWDEAGAHVSQAPGDQLVPVIASDGHGGALIGWQDLRDDPDSDIYAQALDGTGKARWTANGIPIFAGPGSQLLPQVIAGGPGSGIFVWEDSGGDLDETSIRAQAVDGAGNLRWGPNGVRVDDGAAPDAHPVAIDDGDGGMIVAWEAGPVHVQRLDAAGKRLWGVEGVALSTTGGMAPAIVSDGAGGAIIAWQTESFQLETSDIRAQSVRASGALRWGPDGIFLCRAPGAQGEVVAAQDTAGGAIVMWRDARNDQFGDLYAQRVDSSATILWAEDGIVVSDAPGFQESLVDVADGFGGVVAAWADQRDRWRIYAQRVGARGRLGGVPGRDDTAPGSDGPPRPSDGDRDFR